MKYCRPIKAHCYSIIICNQRDAIKSITTLHAIIDVINDYGKQKVIYVPKKINGLHNFSFVKIFCPLPAYFLKKKEQVHIYVCIETNCRIQHKIFSLSADSQSQNSYILNTQNCNLDRTYVHTFSCGNKIQFCS